jgi:hypothetical protein
VISPFICCIHCFWYFWCAELFTHVYIRSPHAANNASKQLGNGFDLEAWIVATSVIEPHEEILTKYDCTQGYRYRSVPVNSGSQVSAEVQALVEAKIQADKAVKAQTAASKPKEAAAAKTAAARTTAVAAGKAHKTQAASKKVVERRIEAQQDCLCFSKCVGVCVNAPLPEGSSRKRLKKNLSD